MSRVKLIGVPSRVTAVGDSWILTWPRAGGEQGDHHHTYGLLTPFFRGLTEGRLMATRCINSKCPVSQGHGGLWLPPRADCPDCHQRMEWVEVENPEGTIHTYTKVERGGAGLEIEVPYYQIDVQILGVCTIPKGYLVDRPEGGIRIGDRVRAGFHMGGEATHTCLDLYWELISS